MFVDEKRYGEVQLDDPSPQEIFNLVARHLFQQGKRSLDRTGQSCRYRSAGGLKCAVGILIPDVMYRHSMENLRIHALLGNFRNLGELPGYFFQHQGLLSSLQAVHDLEDNWTVTSRMQNSLRSVARIYELNSDILQTLQFVDR